MGDVQVAYLHILCVKRKLFSSKKENRLQHHYRLGSQQVQFLPKQEPITEGKQKRLHLSSFSFPWSLALRHQSLAFRVRFIGDYHEKIEERGQRGEGGRERVWRQAFSPCVLGMDWNMILVLFSLQSSSRARKVKTTVGSVKFVWSILYSLICVLVSLLYLIR